MDFFAGAQMNVIMVKDGVILGGVRDTRFVEIIIWMDVMNGGL
jgi:hypothetical protein